MSGEFCDTNVIVYAFDRSAGAKREQARRLLERLSESRAGVLSIQVLQESFVSLTKKVPQPMPVEEARATVADLATWEVIAPVAEDVLGAIDAAIRHRVSFWDAMLLTAARKAEATVLWSEDLNDGQNYDGIVVRSPFKQRT